MKTLILLFASAAASFPATAGILPGVIGPWKKASSGPLEVKTDRALWDEYRLQDSEQGIYAKLGSNLTVRVWRLADSTTSMAALEIVRPSDAKPAPQFDDLTPEAALTAHGALVALGNYLVSFEGAVPEADAVANMFRSLPRFERSGLPTFPSYLPDHAIANSERYIGGPVALKKFVPEIEPSVAGFRMGGEMAVAQYPAGTKLVLFSYPTPSIARDRERELAKTPGALLKRSGPFVAAVLQTQDINAAESLLSQIRYQATVTTGEPPPSKKDNPGNLLLNIFYLILILAGFCLVSGFVFAGFRMVFHRAGASGDGEEILALHLEGR